MSKARRLMPWLRRPPTEDDGAGLYDSVEMFVDDDGDIPVVGRAAGGDAPETENGAVASDVEAAVLDQVSDIDTTPGRDPLDAGPASGEAASGEAASGEAASGEAASGEAADMTVSPAPVPPITVEVIPGVVAMPATRKRPRWFDRAARPDDAAEVFRFAPRPTTSPDDVTDGPTAEPVSAEATTVGVAAAADVAGPRASDSPSDLSAPEGAPFESVSSDAVGSEALSEAVPSEAAGSDEAGSSEAGSHETGSSETGSSETGSSETGSSETGPSETGPSETGPSETVADGASEPVVRPDPSALVADTFADLAAALTAMNDQVAAIESEIDAGSASRIEPRAGQSGPTELASENPTDQTASAPPARILPPRKAPTKTRRTRPPRPEHDAAAGAPIEDAPIEDTPIEDTPVEDAPIEDTRVEGSAEPGRVPNDADRAWDRVAAALNDDTPTRAAPSGVAPPAGGADHSVHAVDDQAELDHDSSGEAMFSVRAAAHACAITPGSIRHHLRSGSFPRAVRAESGEWQIPFGDLERAGLDPIVPAQLPAAPAMSTALERLTTDDGPDALVAATYARLRAEFAEAYANVQAERLMAEAEKWQMVAEERDRSLQRADEALKTVALAVESAARLVRAAAGLPDQPANPAPGQPAAAGTVRFGAKVPPPAQPNATFVAVPDHVRDEARRLADALHASAPPRRRGRIF